MSIASEITRLQTAKSNLKTSINAKGGTIVDETIDDYAGFVDSLELGGGAVEGWQPDPLWTNLHTLIEEDTEDYVGKVAILGLDIPDSISLNLTSTQAQAVKTSDGSFYTETTTHTWNRNLDVIDSLGRKVRWVIYYYSAPNAGISTITPITDMIPLWIVIGGTSFAWKLSGTFISGSAKQRMLEAIENNGNSFLDTSGRTTMQNLFNGCNSLVKIPPLNMFGVTNTIRMFANCSNLVKIPTLDMSAVQSAEFMFQNGSNLRTVTLLNTGNISTMSYAFNLCTKLIKVNIEDTSNITDLTFIFDGADALFNFGHLNLSSHTQTLTNFFPSTIQLSQLVSGTFEPLTVNNAIKLSVNITYETIMSLIGGLVDRTSLSSLNVQLGTNNLNRLSTEEKNMITAKNWTYS